MTTITRERLEQIYTECEERDPAIFEIRELVRIALASLDAVKQELKIADLVNKFDKRYPPESFNTDSDRDSALGYFMAGAELQCFGEFIKYDDLFGITN